MRGLLRKILAFMGQHHMTEPGAHVLVAVSGGADSVCLLLALKELAPSCGLTLSAVHVEHGIRGEESRGDARFVEELCQREQIRCLTYECDAAAFAKQGRMSLEEGARELRYGFFAQAAEAVGADRIAVAHNQNDCAETLLFHLSRGSGLRGMRGIAPVRGNIIRPLLCVGRDEIEAYLRERQQPFRTDATNQDVQYVRNKIRHQVLLPLQEINPHAVAHLCQGGERIAQAWELVEGLADWGEARHVAGGLLKGSLLQEPALLQETIALRLLERMAGSRKDLAAVHVGQVLGLFRKQVGRQLDLPYGVRARRVYGGVLLERASDGLAGSSLGSEQADADVADRSFGDERRWADSSEQPSDATADRSFGGEQADADVADRRFGGERRWAESSERASDGVAGSSLGGEQVDADVVDSSFGNGQAWAGHGDFVLLSSDFPDGFLVEPGMEFAVPGAGIAVSCRILGENADFREIPKKRYTKWFDYDKIKSGLLLRGRRSGDFFVADAQGSHQKLKRYFINEKVPGEIRGRIPLLADGSHVLWIVGYRISEAYKVTDKTKRVLEVRISGGRAHE